MSSMQEDIKKRIKEAVSAIPEGYLTDLVIKETVRCVLFGILKEQGLVPVPAYRNPRFQEGPVDIAGMKDDKTMAIAFCSNPTIELNDIKRLERVDCDEKFVISFSRDQKKVKQSTFFLKPGIEHIDIYGS